MNTTVFDLHTATDDFHLKLQALLYRQGVFQVMQHNLPANPELFLEAHNTLINSQTEFMQAHQRLLDLHCTMVRTETNAERSENQRCPTSILPVLQLTPERKLPSPPMLTRNATTGLPVGYTTPPHPAARRVLFDPEWKSPDFECRESLDRNSEDESL